MANALFQTPFFWQIDAKAVPRFHADAAHAKERVDSSIGFRFFHSLSPSISLHAGETIWVRASIALYSYESVKYKLFYVDDKVECLFF